VFKKCRENSEVLFIDASQNFEKVKTQNVLLPSHIDQIIHTYRNRTEALKFSRLVSLKIIADNDYNLNIPRYVDTFEEADTIDIKVISDNLVRLARERTYIDAVISTFCTQLNIPTPF